MRENADPVTRAWKAWIDVRGADSCVCVQGDVRVPRPDVDVSLQRQDPQGVNPRVLLVNLVAAYGDLTASGPEAVWKTPQVIETCGEGQLDQVVVFHRGRIVADIGIVH